MDFSGVFSMDCALDVGHVIITLSIQLQWRGRVFEQEYYHY
jgi:hypothetical protein